MLRSEWGRTPALAALAMLVLPLGFGRVAADEKVVGPVETQVSSVADVSILDAMRDGRLQVRAFGNGDDRVHLTLRNESAGRLHIVLPAGLVAASSAGQFGGGLQSMGLGSPTSNEGSFGEFRGAAGSGFQAVPVDDQVGDSRALAIGAGQTIEIDIPSVCLNYGDATPTPRDEFQLMRVEDYTRDARAQKALKSLATLGTSQKVAQAVVWNVFNDLSFEAMASKARALNVHELALASRFVEALDATEAGALVDPSALQEGRILVRVSPVTESVRGVDALAAALDGSTVLGLPVTVVEAQPKADSVSSAIYIDLTVTDLTPSIALGQISVQSRAPRGGWISLGKAELQTSQLFTPTEGIADAIDRAMADTFVRVKTVRRSPGLTTVSVENRLPLTIAALRLRAGDGPDAGDVSVAGLGLGPARTTTVKLPAPTARVERVAFNGL